MEETISCINCNQELPNKPNYYFCSKCLTQIRCKNCAELLVSDAIGCISCGIPIVEANNKTAAVNNIEFEQKGNNKRFVANFTDYVGENLVNSLGGLFLGPSHKPIQNPFTQTKGNQLPPGSSTKRFEGNFEDAVFADVPDDELNKSLIKIFRNDDDKIVLINSRVKQSGKRDQAIRITLLLLYAYSLIDKHQIKKATVVEVLQSAAVYDNNYIYWLSKCDEIKKVDNDTLELNLPGRDAAIAILKEFNNTSVEKGDINFSATSTKGNKSKSRKGKQDSTNDTENPVPKSSNSSSKMTPVKMIDILIGENYFAERRRIPEIIKYCKDIKAQTLDTATLSTAMSRMIKSAKLKREKNPSDNQYEYYQ